MESKELKTADKKNDTDNASHVDSQAETDVQIDPQPAEQPENSTETQNETSAAASSEKNTETQTGAPADEPSEDGTETQVKSLADTPSENDAGTQAETHQEETSVDVSQKEDTEKDAQVPTEAEAESPANVPAAARPYVDAPTQTLVQTQAQEAKPLPAANGAHVITAESVEAEQVPTIPLDSLQTIHSLQPEVSVHPVATTRTISMPEPLVVQPSEYRRSLGEWLQIWRDGLRLYFLPLSLAPVLLGTVLAWSQTVTPRTPFGQFHLLHFIGTLVAVLLLQIGANLVNDYYDYLRGVDASNTLGPGGLIRQGQIRPARVLGVGLVLLAIGTILAVIVAVRGGILVALLALLVALCAYFYSATSYALSGKGLGELVGFFIFGPLLTLGAYLIQTGGQLNSRVFIYSLSLGFLATAVLFANNMRDIEGDENAGKRTLANLMGMTLSRLAYMVLLLAAFAVIVPQGVPRGAPHLLLLSLWTLPMLVVAISGALRTNAPAGFHLVMRQTLKLEAFFALLLIIALIITTIIPVVPQIQFSLLKI